MAQPITDYAAFFAGAKQALHEMELLKQRETQLQNLENEVETSLKTKQKSVSDQITMTVKQRTDEIIKSYDAEIGKSNDRLKKVRVKREKAKSQGVKERIAEMFDGSFYVAFTSIHEARVHRVGGWSPNRIKCSLDGVNRDFDREELLSRNVYLYNAKEKTFKALEI